MFGNILGDTAGSVYEFNNIYTKDFSFLSRSAVPTDDTVCSIAVADWLINGGVIEDTMRLWCQGYPAATYGPMFRNWMENTDGKPYGSRGNGAPMRVGATALWFNEASEAYRAAIDVTQITHNSEECYLSVKAVVALQRYAALGATMDALREVAVKFYGDAVNMSLEDMRNRQGPHFDPFAKGTTIQAIVCFLNSTSLEDAVRNCISIGGDCDTSACIAGGIAEAHYGFPEDWAPVLMAKIPLDMRPIIAQYYARRAIQPMVLETSLLDIPFEPHR